jgi:hypothetical protein
MNILPFCDLIIGCSGEVSLSEELYPLLKKNVILASASSSDREFESYKVRRKYLQTSNTHKDFHTDSIVLLNSGFPINFDGYKVSVSLDRIELTLALMFAGGLQALQVSNSLGIVELNRSLQEDIVCEFKRVHLFFDPISTPLKKGVKNTLFLSHDSHTKFRGV